MAECNGWAGTILDVNLTTGEIIKKAVPRDLVVDYVGGTGLAAKILYDELKPGVDPLGPDNIVMVTHGTLSGTLAPSCGRFDVITKAPLTGIFLRTNGGGFFGPELKWAGYELIIIRGQSKTPVYLWIKDDHVELRDASHLWGKDIQTTQQMIRDELDDPGIQTIKIGPAGENQCFSSAVISDLSRAAAKCGVGAAWGAKKLKAIAARGSKGVNIARGDDFLKLCMEMDQRIRQDPVYKLHSHYGTPGWVSDPDVGIGDLSHPAGFTDLFSKEMDDKLFDKSLSCFNCPMHCSHWYTVKEGKYKGDKGEGIEANAVVFAGQMLSINNSAFVAKYNTVCNELGLHVDTPAVALHWAMQLYADGIITKKDTDGIELTWGNEEAILKMMHKMAYKEGFGDILDGYPVRAIEKIGRGSDVYASHVKGSFGCGSGIEYSLEWTLGLAVSTRGRDHLIGAPSFAFWAATALEKGGELVANYGQETYGDSRLTTDPWYFTPKKALLVYDQETVYTLCDMTGVCKFATTVCEFTKGYHLEDFAPILSAATGVDFTTEDMVRATEREMLIERAFNAREGVRRIHEYPQVFNWQLEHNAPHPFYKDAEFPLTIEQYDELLDGYYTLRGCDLETGIPTREKLEQLGMKDVAEDLDKHGILPTAKQSVEEGKSRRVTKKT